MASYKLKHPLERKMSVYIRLQPIVMTPIPAVLDQHLHLLSREAVFLQTEWKVFICLVICAFSVVFFTEGLSGWIQKGATELSLALNVSSTNNH